MKWNNEEGYIDYKNSLTSIKNLLSISQIDFFTLSCEIAPYVTYTLKYLNTRLVMLGEVDMVTKLNEVINIYEEGSMKIIFGGVRDLAFELGIDEGEDYIEGEEIPYNQDRFIFSWTNVMTALSTRLKLQYSSLLMQPKNNECPCNDCDPGQSTKDYESWTSKIYPEDESYSYYNYDSNYSSIFGNNQPSICTKCYRK